VAPAESSGLDAESVDLITVAQALHWFDIEGFFAEAERVLKRGGILSFWCYERCRVDLAVDALIESIFTEVESYWPPERDIVENRYAGIESPFPAIPTDSFSMTVEWGVEDMLGYVRTWSASQRYMADRSSDPTALHNAELRAAWGDGRRTVIWPITLKAGRK
jgi:SAM-dependent methyltransferase